MFITRCSLLKLKIFRPIKINISDFRTDNFQFCIISGYRDGGNMRKYKGIPPHVPPPGTSMYHKHNIYPRHSPHHAAVGYNVHPRDSPHTVVRPPPVSRVDSPKQLNLQHQSTPLARLSPSSEMSQQTPRILTLQVTTLFFITSVCFFFPKIYLFTEEKRRV